MPKNGAKVTSPRPRTMLQVLGKKIEVKLKEIEGAFDEMLPQYIVAMLENKKSKNQITENLQVFLGNDTKAFVEWLAQEVQTSGYEASSKTGSKTPTTSTLAEAAPASAAGSVRSQVVVPDSQPRTKVGGVTNKLVQSALRDVTSFATASAASPAADKEVQKTEQYDTSNNKTPPRRSVLSRISSPIVPPTEPVVDSSYRTVTRLSPLKASTGKARRLVESEGDQQPDLSELLSNRQNKRFKEAAVDDDADDDYDDVQVSINPALRSSHNMSVPQMMLVPLTFTDPVATRPASNPASVPCRYDPNCRNDNCPYYHKSASFIKPTYHRPHNPSNYPSARPPRPAAAAASLPSIFAAAAAASAHSPARPHNLKWQNPDVVAAAVAAIACRYGAACKRSDCRYQHPAGRQPPQAAAEVAK